MFHNLAWRRASCRSTAAVAVVDVVAVAVFAYLVATPRNKRMKYATAQYLRSSNGCLQCRAILVMLVIASSAYFSPFG